jgi:4-amino-4-deoxy-L-arabinose transferase-like glycosyltransferase
MIDSLYWELLSETRWKSWALALPCVGALFFLYFFGLTRTGLLGPDEPRYAAIGRAMAQTGDWITPRLWGKPWFEKPPLLYWMTAAGFKVGLDQDLAPRLPVALVSVAFLIYFFVALRREFGGHVAFYATTILATSAGWLAFSHVAVTDLPMSAAFAAAMLIVMRGPLADARGSVSAGVLLGLAVLAKGLVPLALFLPALWFLRHRIRDLLVILATAAVIAAPWYVLATWRNGTPFLEEFFWKHHFARFASTALGHEQPFWFYLPVLLAGTFPWTPFLALLFQKRTYNDRRAVFLLAWLAWGFFLFSLSRNKLPGYLLPLLPALAALLGITIAQARERSAKIVALLAATAALLWFIPAIQDLLPQALLSGFSRAQIHLPLAWIIPALAVTFSCATLERTGHRTPALALIAVVITRSVVRLVWQTYPLLDQKVSPRGFWISHAGSITCASEEDRSWRYGLNYYAGRDLPDCN